MTVRPVASATGMATRPEPTANSTSGPAVSTDVVDGAGAEVDRHDVVQPDARRVGHLEAVLGVDRRVVPVEDVDATAEERVGPHPVADLVAGPPSTAPFIQSAWVGGS